MACTVATGLAACVAVPTTGPALTNWSREIADGAIPAATVFGGGLYLPDHLACVVGQIAAQHQPWTSAYDAV
ncbi:MAG TPA: hypothetical protein VN613_03355, partial [Gemmatimonadaceae bacterium]|nr:hypothetical protein [Gemmatimonadaceae bacterium]